VLAPSKALQASLTASGVFGIRRNGVGFATMRFAAGAETVLETGVVCHVMAPAPAPADATLADVVQLKDCQLHDRLAIGSGDNLSRFDRMGFRTDPCPCSHHPPSVCSSLAPRRLAPGSTRAHGRVACCQIKKA
jgi:hypothetical protein